MLDHWTIIISFGFQTVFHLIRLQWYVCELVNIHQDETYQISHLGREQDGGLSLPKSIFHYK